MLARPGKLPIRGEWAYEVKWDGFRDRLDGGTAARPQPARLEHD